MRPKLSIGVVLAALSLVSGIGASAEESTTQKMNAANDPLPTIYVEYREDEFYPERSRYNTLNEQDRLSYLKRNFEKVFEKEHWGVNFEYKLYPVDDKGDVDVLEITQLSFDARNRIEVELRTWAKFRGTEEEEDFGVQSIRHSPSLVFTSGSIERDLNEIYSKLAKRIARDLNKTIFREH